MFETKPAASSVRPLCLYPAGFVWLILDTYCVQKKTEYTGNFWIENQSGYLPSAPLPAHGFAKELQVPFLFSRLQRQLVLTKRLYIAKELRVPFFFQGGKWVAVFLQQLQILPDTAMINRQVRSFLPGIPEKNGTEPCPMIFLFYERRNCYDRRNKKTRIELVLLF
jgi:hypothetical protein